MKVCLLLIVSVSVCLWAATAPALHDAIEDGREAEALKLVQEGRNVRDRDATGNSAFGLAVYWGQEKVAKALAEKVGRATLLADEKDQRSMATCAGSENCPLSLLSWLGENGFKVDAKDATSGQTALFLAVGSCARAKVDWLIGHGAPLAAVDAFGQNVLHQAVDRLRMGRSGVPLSCRNGLISELAAHPELKQARDQQGRTPLALAQYLHDHPVEWGTGVDKLTFREALKILR